MLRLMLERVMCALIFELVPGRGMGTRVEEATMALVDKGFSGILCPERLSRTPGH
jgi:hypothetical protein